MEPQNRFKYDVYPERFGNLFDHRPLEQYEPWGEPVSREDALRIARQGVKDLARILAEEDRKRRARQRQWGRVVSQEPDERRLSDWTLQPLFDLKFEGPFEVIGRCGHRMAYAALNPYPEQTRLIVLFAQNVTRQPGLPGGAARLRGATRARPIMSTKDMIEDEMANSKARIRRHEAGEWGDPKGRTWDISCPKSFCNVEERVTNGRSLLLFMQTIVDGDGEMWLGGRAAAVKQPAERTG
jgi:hypothetical protein